MTTRLVLLGLVAALGITLPSRPDCDRVFKCVQATASRVLADWDHGDPRTSEAIVVRDELTYVMASSVPSTREPAEAVATLSEVTRGVWATPLAIEHVANSSGSTTDATGVEKSDLPAVAFAPAPLMPAQPFAPADEAAVETASLLPQLPDDVFARVEITSSSTSVVSAPTFERLPAQVFASAATSVVSAPTFERLPAQVFASVATSVVSAPTLERLPAQVFAGVEPAIVVGGIAAPTIEEVLPIDVFAPESVGSEIRLSQLADLPSDPFAPVSSRTAAVSVAMEVDECPELCGEIAALDDAGDESARDTGVNEPTFPADRERIDAVVAAVEPAMSGVDADQCEIVADPGVMSEDAEAGAVTTEPMEGTMPGDGPLAVTENIAQAVQLTGRALNAWLELLSQQRALRLTTR